MILIEIISAWGTIVNLPVVFLFQQKWSSNYIPNQESIYEVDDSDPQL